MRRGFEGGGMGDGGCQEVERFVDDVGEGQ